MFLCLAWLSPARADIVNPSTLKLTEISPGQFEVVLTLPLIQGRVLKAKPVLPDICVIKGDVEERGGAGSVVRTWQVECDPADLVGAPLGVSGLLGTKQDIQLTIETLDGRRYVQALLPIRSFYAIPPPPTVGELALTGGLQGIQLVLKHAELVLLILLAGFLAWPRRSFTLAILAFAASHTAAQLLAGQYWMVMSPFLPATLTALTALLLAYEILRGREDAAIGWHRPLWMVMLLLGLLYGASQPEAITTMGLSSQEHYFLHAFAALGAAAGLILLVLIVRELRAVLHGLFGIITPRVRYWIGYLAGIVACALFLYELSTPAFVGGTAPTVPFVTLLTAVVLGCWGRLRAGAGGWVFALVAVAAFALGTAMSFIDIALPLATLVVYGSLVCFGATLLLPMRWPGWLALPAVGVAAGYHGCFAGQLLRDGTSLPLANALGMLALLSFVFYACYRVTPGKLPDGLAGLPLYVVGIAATALAIVWRLAEYREWFGIEFAAEYAMGLVRLPLLALILLIIVGLAWPRKRRFGAEIEGGRQLAHWAMLALVFFVFPLGTWRVHNPFYTPRAPSTVEARHIIDGLLTDSYLAFNLADENAAFDRLEANLSEELVADVFLDSRRRLTAGTRQGAQVTVKDVSVMSVAEASAGRGEDQSFTFPCKWVVTARVKHVQHIHDRQNINVGELTIRVEDDRWKITQLVLKSEERVILPWQRSS